MNPDRRSTTTPFNFAGSHDNGAGRFAFATSLYQMRAAAEAEDARKLAAATPQEALIAGVQGPLDTSPSSRAASRPTFDVWVEGISSYFATDRIDGKRQGHAAVVYAGTDAIVLPGLLIGVMAQMDWMSETSSIIGHNASGRGWMAGPYMSARLTRNLFLDARVAWGQSTNQIDPLGAYIDTYSTDRTLASTKLTGDWSLGAFRFRPSAEIIYFAEKQHQYVNAIGISIPDQIVSLGRTMVGPEISYRWLFQDKSVFEPFVGVKGIWDFSTTQETTAAGTPVGNDPLRGRIEVGATYRASSGISVRGAGAYDGIGSSGYHAIQGQAIVTVPFQ